MARRPNYGAEKRQKELEKQKKKEEKAEKKRLMKESGEQGGAAADDGIDWEGFVGPGEAPVEKKPGEG